jgi:segregation and condensation protein A
MTSVNISAYDGPLDALLDLVSRGKMNIWDIPIAELTAGFLALIESAKAEAQPDSEALSEFIVMAATLIEIKSRSLLPRQTDDEPDPRDELAARLLEYKFYKDMAAALEPFQFEGDKIATRAPSPLLNELTGRLRPNLDAALNGVTLEMLQTLFNECMNRRALAVNEASVVPTRPNAPKFTVPGQIFTIRAAVSQGRATFFSLIKTYEAAEIVATFLAVLELIKDGEITITQTAAFGEIELFAYTPNYYR